MLNTFATVFSKGTKKESKASLWTPNISILYEKEYFRLRAGLKR
jgi:hypothetical protein